MKVCFRCKIEKDLSEFNKDKFKPDGMSTYCRKCANEKKRDPNKLWKHVKREPWVEGDICYIPLTKGNIAMCDADMYDKVIGYQWRLRGTSSANVYMQIGRKSISLHRFILPNIKGQIDHINRNPLDNRRSNLREATARQNMANIALTKLNKSGVKGVFWNKKHNKWNAVIKDHGKVKYLGSFFCLRKAAQAYDKAAQEMYGEFAWLNKV